MSTGKFRAVHRLGASALGIAILAFLLIGAASPAAQACPVCFGADGSPLLDGARSGVWVLLAVTGAVQGGFAAFFIYLWRRSRQIGRQRLRGEWAEPGHALR